jgi:hypothetical protein
MSLGEGRAVSVVHNRAVSLTGLHKQLQGVVAMAPEAVVVGRSGAVAAALTAIPDQSTTTDEVNKFVETLLAHGRIDFSGDRTRATRGARALGAIGGKAKAKSQKPDTLTTHRVAMVDGKKTLVRVRFLCGGSCSDL